MGSDQGFRTACSCRLYFTEHSKNLILLESSAPLSNQVEIGQQVQELLGGLTHLCTSTHPPRFARVLFPKGKKVKTHTEGGHGTAPEHLGSQAFITSVPSAHSLSRSHRACPEHTHDVPTTHRVSRAHAQCVPSAHSLSRVRTQPVPSTRSLSRAHTGSPVGTQPVLIIPSVSRAAHSVS